MQYTDRLLYPGEFWAHYAEMEQQIRAAAGSLPCYGVAAWSGPRMIGGWAWEHDHLVTAGLTHGEPDGEGPMVHVRTTTRDPLRDAGALRRAAGPPRGRHDGARRRCESDAAAPEQVTIPVEATAVRFAVWRGAECWWAAGAQAAHGLVLEARRVPLKQVRLVRVGDIEPYIAGRRAYLRGLRGET